MDQRQCLGHVNEFEHVSLDLGGIEREFDLGCKFEFREADSYREIPQTGGKACAEPYLALYLSANRLSAPVEPPPTLRYGLTRSKFANGALQPTEADCQRLLELAAPEFKSDLGVLSEGGTATDLKKPRML